MKKLDQSSWVKAALAGCLLGLLIGSIPEPSKVFYGIGFFLALIYTVSAILRWSNTWWSYVIRSFYLGAFLEILSMRFALYLLPIIWGWGLIILHLIILVAVSMLPILNPHWSASIWNEQFHPHTRIGKLILPIGLGLLSIGGLLGAFIGITTGRLGRYEVGMWIVMILGWIGTVSLVQAASHSLITKRPWESAQERQ